jgi:hypothetical protein
MKSISTIVLLMVTSLLYAQVPKGINYQAVIRDNSGNGLVNKPVGIRINIRTGSVSGVITYAEAHSTNTNGLGLINLVVGQGTPIVGTFNGINWGANTYFAEILTDNSGGTNYQSQGTQQLMAVPYAFYAEKTADDNQTLSVNGNTLAISEGNSVTLPVPNIEKQTLSLSGNTLSISGGNSVTLPTNNTNNQTLSINGNTLSISGGNSVAFPSATVTVNNDILEGNGTSNSPLNIKNATPYYFLRTDDKGKPVWAIWGTYSIGGSGGFMLSTTPSTINLTNFTQYKSNLNGIVKFQMRVYSPTQCTVYLKFKGDANPVRNVYDIAAGRSIIAYSEALNGEFEIYASVGVTVEVEFIGFLR